MGMWNDFIALFKKPNTDTLLMNELLMEAQKWIGLHEKRGEDSLGVNSFRRAVDDVAVGEPWCAAYVCYCIRAVSPRTGAKIAPHLSELCFDMWHKTPSTYKIQKPVPGSIIVWNYPGSTRGHMGFVVKKLVDDKILTLEGNTKLPGDTSVSGTGVYFKTRSTKGADDMKILGYLLPFKK